MGGSVGAFLGAVFFFGNGFVCDPLPFAACTTARITAKVANVAVALTSIHNVCTRVVHGGQVEKANRAPKKRSVILVFQCTVYSFTSVASITAISSVQAQFFGDSSGRLLKL